jgi:tetrahydromethanopterin S-methyltransferase subunit F
VANAPRHDDDSAAAAAAAAASTDYHQQGLRPIPDPTVLTTAALAREVTSLKELIFTRLDGMDKAVELFNENITRVPTDTDKQILHLKEFHGETFKIYDERFKVHTEKFSAIEGQFSERDVRTQQVAELNQKAIDAALQAAKEAVGKQNDSFTSATSKQEAAFTKQIDQMGTLIQTTTGAINDKIDDIKSRLTIIEGRDTGSHSTLGSAGMIAGLVIAALAITVTVVIAVLKHP